MIRNFEISGRQSGKTHRILERMIDGEGITYVAATAQGAEWAFQQAMKMLEERAESWDDSVVRRFRQRFVTWRDAADPRIIPTATPIAIDNLDTVLAHIFGPNIDTVTMSPPERMTTYRNIEGNTP